MEESIMSRTDQQCLKTQRVKIYYPLGFESYARAIGRLIEAVIDVCAEKFGFHYERLVKVKMKHSDRLALWVAAPEPEITLEFSQERQLYPPQEGGAWNVYGFIHEFGHLVVWIENAPELGQGWADYFAFSLMPLVWERLGESAWAIPHNYWALEQERRQEWEQDALSNPDSHHAASWYFWRLEQKHGAERVGEIIRHYNKGEMKLERLIDIISEVTGENASYLQRFVSEDIDWSSVAEVLMIADEKGNLLVHYVDDMLFPGGKTAGLTFPLYGDWEEIKVVEVCFSQFNKRFTPADLKGLTIEGGESPQLSLDWGWEKAIKTDRMWMRSHLIYYVEGAAERKGNQWCLCLFCPGDPSQLRVGWHLILPPNTKPKEIEPEPVDRQFIGGRWSLVWEWQKPPQKIAVIVCWE